MLSGLWKFINFKLPEPPEQKKPLDLSNFDEARKRLHQTLKRTSKEVDTFGDMIREMASFQLPPPPAKQQRTRAKKSKGAR